MLYVYWGNIILLLLSSFFQHGLAKYGRTDGLTDNIMIMTIICFADNNTDPLLMTILQLQFAAALCSVSGHTGHCTETVL